MDHSDWVKNALAAHGTVRSQPATDWKGPGELPQQLADFYQRVGPVDVGIPGYGNGYFLPSLAMLWEHQMGYSRRPTGEPIEGWSPDWIVVADEGGDPFIFEKSSGRILHDHHGQGAWEPEELFETIDQMAGCLALMGAVIEAAGEDFTDDDSYIKPAYLSKAVAALAKRLGSTDDAEAVLGVLGWGI